MNTYLDYGTGTVKVEMDDRHWDPDGYTLVEGDKVTVTGLIDDDAFEMTKIEAGSVFVESLGTYFFASAVDEEDTFVPVAPVVVSATVVQGKVTSVDGRKFTLDTGKRKLTVDTSAMSNNPLDDEGYQKIKEGDRVSVGGQMDKTFWGKRQLEASQLSRWPNRTKRRDSGQMPRKRAGRGRLGAARTRPASRAAETPQQNKDWAQAASLATTS